MTYEFERIPQAVGFTEMAKNALLADMQTADVTPNRLAGRDAELRIAMISSCQIFCECLEEALRARAPRVELQSFSNADEMARDLDGYSPPHLAILYIGLRKASDPSVGGEVSALATRFAIPVVVLAEGEEIDEIRAAIDAGAKGYVAANMPLKVVVEALQIVRAGGMFIPASCIFSFQRASVEARVAQHGSEMIFTVRQAAVVRALRQGMANKRIAYELNMCESTVKVHVRNIMRKLNARNRTEVAFRTNDLFAGDAAP